MGDQQEWVAGIPWWRISMLGGTLALTDEAVIFTPLAGFGRTRRFALADVESVSVVADKPPRLQVNIMNGTLLILIVLPTRNTPVWQHDASARDHAVAAINEWLAHK